MQKRVGLLYLSLSTRRILLILENDKWTVPTFSKEKSVIEDSQDVQEKFAQGKILPIELYLSKDKGFEYGTYICLVNEEFLTTTVPTFCWADLDYLPKNVHVGLKSTLNNNLIRTKIETVLELEDAITL
jgi:hypothetical protein